MLTDKVVIVTGATGTLGRAVVEALLVAGASVAVVGGRQTRVAQLVDELRAGDRIVGQSADLTNEDETTSAVTAVAERLGGIDGLVATAGGFGGGNPIHETTLSDWHQQQELNLTTAFLTCKATVPHLIQRGGGSIVTIGSRTGLHGAPNVASYSVAKGGIVRLTEALAAELMKQNITANCLLPSTIDTPANREGASEKAIAKWVQPAEIAAVALFLLGPQARIISGAAIPVYGRA